MPILELAEHCLSGRIKSEFKFRRKVLSQRELDKRFNHHPPSNPETIGAHAAVRDWCKELAKKITILVPAGREQENALDKIEEVMFWANAGIARNQEEGN